MPAPRIAKIGEVYSFALQDGRFGAAQVISRHEEKVEIVVLDGLWTKAPSLAQLKDVGVLPRPGTRGPARRFVDRIVPWYATYLGIQSPRAVTGECNVWGGWTASDSYWSWRRKQRPQPRPAPDSSAEISIDIGGGPVSLRRDTWRLHLYPGQTTPPLPKTGPVRFDALEVLEELSEIHYTGADPGFLSFVRRHPWLNTVGWQAHGLRELDLGDTWVSTLILEVGQEPLKLIAPRCLSELSLIGRADKLTVENARVTYPFSLRVNKELPVLIPGLESLEHLHTWALKEADARRLAHYGNLKQLELRGAPGILSHATRLRALPELRQLVTYDLYELDATHFPSADCFPHLCVANFSNLCKDDAVLLKKRLASLEDGLQFRGARSRAWIAAFLDNPFRDWDEQDENLGKKACAAWTKAVRAAARLGKTADKADAEKVLKGLVSALNRLEDFIDTIDREQAADAFFDLAGRMGIGDEQAEKWFDAWRDF